MTTVRQYLDELDQRGDVEMYYCDAVRCLIKFIELTNEKPKPEQVEKAIEIWKRDAYGLIIKIWRCYDDGFLRSDVIIRFPQVEFSRIDVVWSGFAYHSASLRHEFYVYFGDKQIPQEDFIKMVISGQLKVDRLLNSKIEYIGNKELEEKGIYRHKIVIPA